MCMGRAGLLWAEIQPSNKRINGKVQVYVAWIKTINPIDTGGRRGLAVSRWTQSRRSRVRYCSGASFIKILPQARLSYKGRTSLHNQNN